MRYLLGLVLVAALVAGGVFVYAGRLPGPTIEIAKPSKYVGQATPVEIGITAPGGRLTAADVVFEQNGKQTPLFSLNPRTAVPIEAHATAALQTGQPAAPGR